MIQHFITDFERNGRYTAFPALGIEWQKMESPFLRKSLGMKVRLPVPCDSCSHMHAAAHLVVCMSIISDLKQHFHRVPALWCAAVSLSKEDCTG